MVDVGSDDVVLRVPARPPYARVVRVGAAALALRRGMSFGEIDDLRLAIDEAMIVLLDGIDDGIDDDTDDDTGAGPAIDLEIVFRISNGHFELEAVRSEDRAVSEAAIHRFDAIAGGLVDEYEIDPDHGWLRLLKTPRTEE